MAELDAAPWVGSQQSRVGGQNPLCPLAGNTALDLAQDTVGFLRCKCTSWGYTELLINLTILCACHLLRNAH